MGFAEERTAREKLEMKIYACTWNRTDDPLLSNLALQTTLAFDKTYFRLLDYLGI